MSDRHFKQNRVSIILPAQEANAVDYFDELGQADSQFTIDPDGTVAVMLDQAFSLSGVEVSEFESRVPVLKDALLLEPILKRICKTLSRGERQRVQLACDLVGRAAEPSLLLFEEPCRAMDAGFKRRTTALIKSLAQEGCAVVVTLKEASLASRMGDYFYLVDSQGLVAEGDHSILTTATLSQLFEVDVESTESTEEGYPQFTVSGSSF